MEGINPLSIFLVKDGSKGDRLLFRYPYTMENRDDEAKKRARQSPYSVEPSENILYKAKPPLSNIKNGQLSGFDDTVLSNLFAVKMGLCEKRLEVKVNDVRFIGHPTLLQSGSSDSVLPRIRHSTSTSIILINIVIVLRASASHWVVECYYELSQRLGVALRHEEHRCQYLHNEARLMLEAHDEVAAQPEDSAESPYDLILERSRLAKELRDIYHDLCTSGVVKRRLNNWIGINFCLPQKVHYLRNQLLHIEPGTIYKCLESIQPYHGILLLGEESELLASLPPDSSSSLKRLVKMASPLKNFHQLAADTNLTLLHIFQLTSHLVYWAKVMVIYPLCETNVYVITPGAPADLASLGEEFREVFPGLSLLSVLSEFSLPTSLSHKHTPIWLFQQQNQQVQVIVWLLRHRLLMQLHTYVFFSPPVRKPIPSHIRRSSRQSTPDFYLGLSEGSSEKSDGDSDVTVETQTQMVQEDQSQRTLAEEDEERGSKGDSELQYEALFPNLSQLEIEVILACPAACDAEDLKLFARMLPYFHGKHHIEEMMFMENMRRSQLLELIEKFRPVLLTCTHEDPRLAIFYHH